VRCDIDAGFPGLERHPKGMGSGDGGRYDGEEDNTPEGVGSVSAFQIVS
jgi:hypothetical protein